MAKAFLGVVALCSVASSPSSAPARTEIRSCVRSSFTPSTRWRSGKTVQEPWA